VHGAVHAEGQGAAGAERQGMALRRQHTLGSGPLGTPGRGSWFSGPSQKLGLKTARGWAGAGLHSSAVARAKAKGGEKAKDADEESNSEEVQPNP